MSSPHCKPRILCLHGMGSNARIFEIQTRQLRRLLDPHFDFVFITAPIECDAGPEILPFFDGCGPFFRWLCSDDLEGQEKILLDLHRIIDDDAAATEEPFVAVMGFSEGASIATSLILDQQERCRRTTIESNLSFRFVILLSAGNSPPFLFRDHVFFTQIKEGTGHDASRGMEEHRVTIPSVHVLGLSDTRLTEGRDLLRRFYNDSISTVFECEGGHQLPTSPNYLARLAILILRQYRS
jgi:Serine hydrolase (FSH1)